VVDLSRIEGFDWDAGNSHKSVQKHGVSRAEAEQIFFNAPLLIADDVDHSGGESRFHAMGRTDGEKLLHVTFALRGDDRFIRVISARTMNARERLRYEQEA
jgi:uncharacterized DUF497 family protein